MSRFNPLILWILRSPLHFLLSTRLMLITVVGRRSGKRYTIPVGYQRSNGEILVLISQARNKQWWRNYLEPSDVCLVLKGATIEGHATVAEKQSQQLRSLLESTLRRMPFLGKRFGVVYDRRNGLSDQQWLALSENTALLKITLRDY